MVFLSSLVPDNLHHTRCQQKQQTLWGLGSWDIAYLRFTCLEFASLWVDTLKSAAICCSSDMTTCIKYIPVPNFILSLQCWALKLYFKNSVFFIPKTLFVSSQRTSEKFTRNYMKKSIKKCVWLVPYFTISLTLL